MDKGQREETKKSSLEAEVKKQEELCRKVKVTLVTGAGMWGKKK
jgi:hypothetical protein